MQTDLGVTPPRDLGPVLGASPYVPSWHGPAREFVNPGRAVVLVPGYDWPMLPEECTETRSEWFTAAGTVTGGLDGIALLCLGCGLDGT